MKAAATAAAVMVGLALAAAPASACQSALSLIEQAEGFRSCEYMDTTGHRTICYGFNLDAGGARQKVENVGGDFDKVYNGGCLSQSQCQTLLQGSVSSAQSSAGWIFGQQCPCVQAVLTDMTYNLGSGGMSTFTTFISLIKAHKWQQAADDAKGTAWCGQVGSRCSRDVSIIASGCQGGGGGGGNDDNSPSGSCDASACRNCRQFGGGSACYSKYGCTPSQCGSVEEDEHYGEQLSLDFESEPASCIAEAKKLCGAECTGKGFECWKKCAYAHEAQMKAAGCKTIDEMAMVAEEAPEDPAHKVKFESTATVVDPAAVKPESNGWPAGAFAAVGCGVALVAGMTVFVIRRRRLGDEDAGSYHALAADEHEGSV